jgi:hypothetical protein
VNPQDRIVLLILALVLLVATTYSTLVLVTHVPPTGGPFPIPTLVSPH